MNPDRVIPILYNVDTCPYLTWHSALLVKPKDWLVQYQVNVTEWYTGHDASCHICQLGQPLGSHHEYALLQVGTHPVVAIYVART